MMTPDKKAVNDAKLRRIAEAIEPGPRHYALDKAMWNPLGRHEKPARYYCDFCGWTKVVARPVTVCPVCQHAVGCYDLPPKGTMAVFSERRHE